MLGFYSVSLTGKRHLSLPNPVCQDACAVKTLNNGWIAAAVADGLSSAVRSDVGAALAANSFVAFVDERVPELWDEEGIMSLARCAFQAALDTVRERAESDGADLTLYDTTLSAAVYDGRRIVFGHVGDGGIIALTYSGNYKMLTKAQKGNASNETYPLRFGPESWIFGAPDEDFCAVLLMTDGVYDVACPPAIAKSEQPIWIRFARPFMDMNILKAETPENFENIQEQVGKYLDSYEQVTDDKTVVGIINTDAPPPVKPDEYYKDPDWKKIRADIYEHLFPGINTTAPEGETGHSAGAEETGAGC